MDKKISCPFKFKGLVFIRTENSTPVQVKCFKCKLQYNMMSGCNDAVLFNQHFGDYEECMGEDKCPITRSCKKQKG